MLSKKPKYKVIGIRPGEKHEEMITKGLMNSEEFKIIMLFTLHLENIIIK